MIRLFILAVFLFILLFQTNMAFAQNNSFVSIVNPIREEGMFSFSLLSVISKFIKFIFFTVFVLLIPGMVLTTKLGKNYPFLQKIFLAMVVGIVAITLIFYLTNIILNLGFLIYLYILINLGLFIKLGRLSTLKLTFAKNKQTLAASLVILGGTIFQNIPVFRNGLNFPYGLGFWGPNAHDGIWHISLINQAVKGGQIENPIFAGTNLQNYHFFYDLMVAATVFLTGLPVMDLVFRFYSVVFSLLLGLGTYFLSMKLLKNRLAALFGLYFVYFAGSFGWIVEYLKNKNLGGESAFWANQSISFNLNPPFAVSLLIIIAFLLFFEKVKNSFFWSAILILLAGSLVGFKAYGAVLIFAALTPVAILNIFKKNFILLYILIFSALFSTLIFLSNFQTQEQLIIFSPFWLIHSMIDSPDRVGWFRLSLARMAGLEQGDWFKFLVAETLGLTIFLFGNLGTRIFALLYLLKFKYIVRHTTAMFIFIFSVLSFTIPFLFIQSGNPWNIIQFFYYGLYISAVFAGGAVVWFMTQYHRLSVIIFPIIVILTPINSITTASYYIGRPHAIISPNELVALNFLSSQSDGVVLTPAFNEKIRNKLPEPRPLFAYDSTAYVSAFSKKAVFIEDEPQNEILLTDYKKRLIAAKDFFLKNNNDFLLENGIEYIYLPKIFNINPDINTLSINNIFENKEVIIYRVR